jgi:hypothetical protein
VTSSKEEESDGTQSTVSLKSARSPNQTSHFGHDLYEIINLKHTGSPEMLIWEIKRL